MTCSALKPCTACAKGGQVFEVFASARKDTIILAGFGYTNEHIVNLYAVDESWNLSEPETATIKPLTPMFMNFELWGTTNPKPLIPEYEDEDRLTNLRYWTAWQQIGGADEWKNDWRFFKKREFRHSPAGNFSKSE